MVKGYQTGCGQHGCSRVSFPPLFLTGQLLDFNLVSSLFFLFFCCCITFESGGLLQVRVLQSLSQSFLISLTCLLLLNTTHIKTRRVLEDQLYPPSFKDLVIVAQENSTKPTAGALVENQPQPPLNLVTVSSEQELHTPSCRTEHGPFVLLITQHLTSSSSTTEHYSCLSCNQESD